MGKEYMFGLMAKYIKVNGNKISFMVKASFIGLMALIFKAIIKMIKEMGRE